MADDRQRIQRIRRALGNGGLDALVCALPSNILLLSGYCPVVGPSLAVATKEGRVGLVAPADERTLAEHGWADVISEFHPTSLDEIRSAVDVVGAPLLEVVRSLNLEPEGRRIGYEHGMLFESASYVGMHLHRASSVLDVLHEVFPGGHLMPADKLL